MAFGDWDRNGTLDIFIQMGGAVQGDRYHNVLFHNPGQGNNWLSVKLVGKKTQPGGDRGAHQGRDGGRATADGPPARLFRAAVSGPTRWNSTSAWARPTGWRDWRSTGRPAARRRSSRDIAVNQGVVITEFATDYRPLSWRPISLPKGS